MAIQRRSGGSPMARVTRGWDPFETMRALMRWDPFQDELPSLFGGREQPLAYVPAFDVRESKDGFVFEADLPGFREEDLEINVTGNRITISGKREMEKVEETDTFYAMERGTGSFQRSFTLPSGCDLEHVEATLANGVLTLKVPKTAEAQPRRIAVKSGEEAPQVTSGQAQASGAEKAAASEAQAQQRPS